MLAILPLSCRRDSYSQIDEQTRVEDLALTSFLDNHPGLGQQVVRQTVRITIFDDENPMIRTSGSAIIVDDHHIVTAAHILRDLAAPLAQGGFALDDELAVLVDRADGETIFRADVTLNELLQDSHPKLSLKTPLSIEDVLGDTLRHMPNTDIALLTLKHGRWSQVLRQPVAPILIDVNSPFRGDKLYSFGYARSNARLALHATFFEANEKVGFLSRPGLNEMIARRVAYPQTRVFPGDSGGPLIVVRANGDISLVGLVNSASRSVGESIEVFMTFRTPLVEIFLRQNNLAVKGIQACLVPN